MFNIDQSIAKWRRQMLDAGVTNVEALNELESHLREDVDRQTQSGAGAEWAFEAAVQRIGQAGPLKREFAKVGGRKWLLFRKLKGFLGRSAFPLPSLDNFTSGARQTLELARTEAPRLHHNFIGTEHVLLGLLALESGVVPNVLKKMSVDREALRKQVEQWISIFPSVKSKSQLPFTPRVRKALLLAAREARAWNHDCVDTGHILLGLLMEGDGVAARVLRNLGLSSETTRKEILLELGGTQPGA